MKNGIVYLSVALMLIAGISCSQSGSVKKVKLETSSDSAGYAIGLLVGTNNKQQIENVPGGSNINLDAVMAAFHAGTFE